MLYNAFESTTIQVQVILVDRSVLVNNAGHIGTRGEPRKRWNISRTQLTMDDFVYLKIKGDLPVNWLCIS